LSFQKRARLAIVEAARTHTGVVLDEDYRTADLSPLVVPALTHPERERALRDVAAGDGEELRWTLIRGRVRPPSLHSAYSSCLFALNTFGPWRLSPETLLLDRSTSLMELRHECKLRIFRGGRAPNLDVVVWNDDRVLAVESKLTEHLAPHASGQFKEKYDQVVDLMAPGWRRLYKALKEDPGRFRYLDAHQLVRHHLGLQAQLRRRRSLAGKEASLIYLYWEPLNGDEHEVVQVHRAEVASLESVLEDTSFVPMTYQRLLDSWRGRSQPAWLADHIGHLEARYLLAV
jgi:hypothetical protein